MTTGKKSSSRRTAGRKKAYRAPKLSVPGDIRALTRSKKGKTSDGFGKPKTRMSILNA